MELSREAYQLIVQNIGNKADLCTLARVSKPFQFAAERALYNTLYMRDPGETVTLCKLLASQHRLAIHVDALTVFVNEGLSDNEPSDKDDGYDQADEADEVGGGKTFPDNYWEALAGALQRTIRLRFFNLHIDGDPSHAWILRDCTFKLRTFHCDLAWDEHLVSFLDTQNRLEDLYLADYAVISTLVDTGPAVIQVRDPECEAPPPGTPTSPLSTPASQYGEQVFSTMQSSVVHPVTVIDGRALSALSTLECSFADAFTTFTPGRPIARVKTCFSREDSAGKAQELTQLLGSLRRSSRPIRCLDLADSSYTEEFSLTVLGEVTRYLLELQYLGTLVLPVGRERLKFYGFLMRLPKLRTIELEVSDWDPTPAPNALRALASEVRLYCPSVTCIVFVQEFERTVVRVIDGFCVVDYDASTDDFWREF